MRYGENPHQDAAFYRDPDSQEASVSNATSAAGQGAVVQQYRRHRRRAGVRQAVRRTGLRHRQARQSLRRRAGRRHDGGLPARLTAPIPNRPSAASSRSTAARRGHRRQHPRTAVRRGDHRAQHRLRRGRRWAGKENVRLLECGQWETRSSRATTTSTSTADCWCRMPICAVSRRLEVVSDVSPTRPRCADLLFAWQVAKFVKSNAIVYAADGMTIGVGAGQMSRINSARIAGNQGRTRRPARNRRGMASDAFFPFRDGIDAASEGRHQRGDPARRIDARRRGHRRGQRTRHGDGVHRHAPLPSLATGACPHEATDHRRRRRGTRAGVEGGAVAACRPGLRRAR